MYVEKLPILHCCRFKNDSFEFRNPNVDAELGVLTTQIGLQPQSFVSVDP
jgi:hypothetical protein